MINTQNYNKYLTITYLLLFIIAVFLLHYIIGYDSMVIYCDSGNTSIDQFTINDTDTDTNMSNSNRNPNTRYSSDRPLTDLYSNDACCSNIFDKYKNQGRRKIYWLIFEKGNGKYTNYIDFKKSWDPKINIISQIKTHIKSDLENTSHKFSLAKRSLSWFVRGSKPGGGRGL